MAIVDDRQRTWRFPRPLLMAHILFASMLWAGLVVVSLGISAGFAWFSEVPGSIWEQASNVAAWYVAVVGGYVVNQVVPMHIAHGRTRRDTTLEATIFMVSFSATAAGLVAIGYLVEYAAYGIAGWPRELSGERLFTSHLDVPMILTQSWLIFIVWGAAGVLVGAAYYRYGPLGWLAGIPAAILIGVADIFTRIPWEPIGDMLERFLSVEGPSPGFAILISIICFAIGSALSWPILRDVPIRNR